MKRLTAAQTQKETLPSQIRGVLHHAAVRTTSENDMLSNIPAETSFDHNFSQVAVRPLTPEYGQDYSNMSCPFLAQRCPFGGACHTCPPSVQAKLKIGKPGDKYEQEADRVADEIMRLPEPQMQRKECSSPSCKEDGEDEILQPKPIGSAGNAGAQLDHPLFQNVLASPGQPLDATTRSFMEPRFGQDFSGVRVHVNEQAAESARAVKARAYTVGGHVVFGEGQYVPRTDEGKRLVAHELVHVGQQHEQSAVGTIVQRAITLTDPGDEIPHAPGAMGPFPTKAFTLDSWLDTLCPDGNWQVDNTTGVVDSPDQATFCGARPTRGHVHHTTSAHSTSCGCLCELTAAGSRDVEVQIDENLTVGAHSIPLGPAGEGATVHLGPTDKISAFTGREFVGITGAGATSPHAGAGRTQTIPDPPWVIFGHEVCGHARLQAGPMGTTQVGHATTPQGDRTTVDIENRIRREHSTVTSSLGIRGGTFRARNAAGHFATHFGAVYRASGGETLSGIAVRCGIPVADLRDHIWRFNGDRITVATQGTLGTGEDLLIEGIDWHEVIRRENMSRIAQMWNVPLASLKRANPQITGPSFIIRPGDMLLIPAS
jgi:hypothetical protein